MSKSNNNNLQQQEKLIALLILESYSENLKPLNSKRAECLLPLFGGKTMLDNNIEYLIENKIEEIYLFCTNHHQQIRAHVEDRKWKKKCEIHFLYNLTCQNMGDAMREIDAKNLISSTFILITASAVLSNVKLSEHLELHKQLSKLDKNAVMTMIMEDRQTDLSYEFNQNDAASLVNKTNTLVIHNSSNRVLHYDQQASLSSTSEKPSKYLKLPADLFQNAYHTSKQLSGNLVRPSTENHKPGKKIGIQSANSELTIDSIQHLKQIQHRNDLTDAQIYLCSPYVLHMFTDNFDYGTMLDFVRGVLVDEEVAGYTVYIDIINKKPGSHFSTITNLNSYFFETLNLIKRTDLILNATERANYNRVIDKCNSFVSRKSVKLGKNVRIDRNVLIEANSMIGDGCELVNCLIGAKCVLGSNVKLSNCILWPNTHIGSNSVLNAALLGNNVKIGNNCHLCENILFANDCCIKDNTQLTKRAIFVPSKIVKDPAQEDTMSIHEDNYTKYFLNSDTKADGEDDDEFDDDDDTPGGPDYDAESVDSATHIHTTEALNDTGKNNHFFVWKSKTITSLKNKLLRQVEDVEGSGGDTDGNESIYSDTSSDYGLDSESEDDGDYAADDEPGHSKSAAHAKSTHDAEDSEIFAKEASEILKRGFKENLSMDNVILEINSCKHAHAIQIEDLCYYLVKVMFDLPMALNKTEASSNFDYLAVIKQQMQKGLGSLCKNYYMKTKQSQKIFLNALLDFFVEASPVNNVNLLDSYYVKLVHYLYDDEKVGFLSDDLILEWYDAKLGGSKVSAKHNAGLKKLENFISWLREEDDDEDEEEDDDE